MKAKDDKICTNSLVLSAYSLQSETGARVSESSTLTPLIKTLNKVSSFSLEFPDLSYLSFGFRIYTKPTFTSKILSLMRHI